MDSSNLQNFKTHQYCGAIHIHSVFSDGTGNVDSISRAAKAAGLDWIIITDHNSLEIEEGIFNDVYVIKGEEISPKNNHYLALGINEVICPDEAPTNYVNKVRELGGFGFAAHPDEGANNCRKNKWAPIFWEDKNIIPDGIEIWNWFSGWADNLNDESILSIAYSFFNKHKTIPDPYRETLNWWDELNRESKKTIPAIGGIDAHALKIYDYLIPLTIFPYKTCFKTINNVITLKEPLSGTFYVAKEQILNELKNGNNIIINRNLHREIPQIYFSTPDKNIFFGETVALCNGTCLNIKADITMNLKLVHNGNTILDTDTCKCKIPVTEAGNYRVELYYKNRGYVFTNPIRVIT